MREDQRLTFRGDAMKAVLAIATSVATLATASAGMAQNAMFECRTTDRSTLRQFRQTDRDYRIQTEATTDYTQHYAPDGVRVFGFPASKISSWERGEAWDPPITRGLATTVDASRSDVVAAVERTLGRSCTPSRTYCYIAEPGAEDWALTISNEVPVKISCVVASRLPELEWAEWDF